MVSIIVALVGALLTALFSGLWKFMLLPLWGSSFLCIGGIAGFVLSFNNTDKYLKEELSKILLEFGFDTAEEFAKAVEEYRTACEKYEEQKERYTAEMQGFLTAGNALKSGEETALNEMRKFFPAVSSVEQAAKAAEEAEKLFHMLSQAEAIALSAENVSRALQAEYEGDFEETTEFVPKPLRSREDTKAAIERAENKLQELSKEYNILCGQAQAVGDPVVLMGEIKELEEKLSVQEEQYDALSLAVEILTGAENEMQLRFSPVISRRAGEIMKRLTGGKYEKVSFDKNFDALAKESGETVGRSALSLSEGTENQLYLALRIAMCELILTGDDPCPLILDDALFSFDDERMKKTLDYLKEISETRQILLFSCQTREAEYFKGADDVHFITLA